jgi:heptosyltransferase-2
VFNVNQSAVIQVKRGIGDVIWHLPFIRAIAAASPGGKVTFLAPPSSGAKELLAAEPSVAETIYFEHSGNELRRVVNLFRLASLLRQNHFQTLWILDRTSRPALAAALAGIPERIGPGLGRQRLLITNRGIDKSYYHKWPVEWLIALLAEMEVPLPTSRPELHVGAPTVRLVNERYQGLARPWTVLGLGASHSNKDWPDRHWTQFLAALRQRNVGTVFLIGGTDNASRAANLVARGTGADVVNACDLKLGEAAALLHLADLFVGPDSGPMNIAAATGTEAFALFGATPVVTYSTLIHPITPQGGPAPGGMDRISPLDVLARIAPYLDRRQAEK